MTRAYSVGMQTTNAPKCSAVRFTSVEEAFEYAKTRSVRNLEVVSMKDGSGYTIARSFSAHLGAAEGLWTIIRESRTWTAGRNLIGHVML